jgi:hypothetical protein
MLRALTTKKTIRLCISWRIKKNVDNTETMFITSYHFKPQHTNHTIKSVTTIHHQLFLLTWHAMAAPVFHPMRITGLPGKSVFSSLILDLVAAIIWSRQVVMVIWPVAVPVGMTTIITWPSVDRCANHCCARAVCIEPLFGLDGAITRMGWLGNFRWKGGP